jgi:hypothetical protein
MPTVTLVLTQGTTFTVPVDAGNGFTVECIGSGLQGGGAYSKTNLLSIAPGTKVYMQIGAYATDTWLNTTNTAPTSTSTGCLAKGAPNAIVGNYYLGGPASGCIGDVKYSGGRSGYAVYFFGGGGAAGPHGNGANGGDGASNGNGGGGGGADGGSVGGNATVSTSGAGGNNRLGTGGGAGNSSFKNGTNGGGGGGLLYTTYAGNDGGNSSSEATWTDSITGISVGPGSGSGGGLYTTYSYCSCCCCVTGYNGGAGDNFPQTSGPYNVYNTSFGGGIGGVSQSWGGISSGVIIITYTPKTTAGTTYTVAYDVRNGIPNGYFSSANLSNKFRVPYGVTSVTVHTIGIGAPALNNGGSTVVGGGGGAYALTTITGLTGGQILTVQAQQAFGSDTWISTTTVAPTSSSQGALAKCAAYNTTGAGGQASACIGTTVYSGGNGGTATASGTRTCGGGGGAAGPSGAGKNGGNGKTATTGNGGGGGGGGSNGGSSTVGSIGTTNGGNGGVSSTGTAGGAGGVTTAGSNGSNGSGGGGGGSANFMATVGGSGAGQALWTDSMTGLTYGPSGGGGGCGYLAANLGGYNGGAGYTTDRYRELGGGEGGSINYTVFYGPGYGGIIVVFTTGTYPTVTGFAHSFGVIIG